MLDPYRMIVVNFISSFVLLGGAIFYRFVFPKKNINIFLLLALISILPIISIFRNGDYESGDFNIHIYRAMEFYGSLSRGIIMPSWAGNLNATYGYPLFIFNYSLPYYGISLLHFVGFSFINSMKIFLGSTLYLSGIFMYLWIKELLNNKLAAFTAAIFYVFSPYHLIDVHFRATFGESTIFMILPLLFLSLTKYSKSNKFIYLILTILFTDLLFLAHTLLAGVFLGITVLYIIFTNLKDKNFKIASIQLLSVLIGTILSIYIWIPFFIYSPYTFRDASPIGEIIPSFYPFIQILYSPWRFGLLFQGPKGELSLIIGYVQIFALIFSTILIFTRKVSKKILSEYVFWIFLCLIFIFLMHPYSSFIWKHIYSFGGTLTIYGRLSLSISFCTSIIAGYLVLALLNLKINKIYIYILLALAIGSTILNWGHRKVIPEINDSVLLAHLPKSTSETEGHFYANTKWVDIKKPWFSDIPKSHLDIITGTGQAANIFRSSILHKYTIIAKSPLKIRENTLYFPGWEAKLNGKTIPISPDNRGLISFYIPRGSYSLDLTYNDLLPYKFTKAISFIGFILILGWIIYFLLFKRGHSKK